ncbi:hypothetical protein ACFV4F_04015 [Kitasatospora sp. NPDC059722]|uniref:hypothetical protein n=1 Tax=Kitasatospora sp. NPDC059722 TaxID=3346925 RepID=UPI0036BA2FE3
MSDPRPAAAPVTVATDAGMLALWSPAAFSGVVDHASWEPELSEEEGRLRHIRAGALVPINIRSDGAFGVVVRAGSAAADARLTERESAYVVVSSKPYLLRSRGVACLSGIEAVAGEPWPDTVRLDLADGDHSVVVHLIDWEAEPGSTADGKPSESALADFVVLVNPASAAASGPYRVATDTFELGE